MLAVYSWWPSLPHRMQVHWRTLISLFQGLFVEPSISARGGTLCTLPRFLSDFNLYRSCSCCHSFWVHMWVSPVVCGKFCFLKTTFGSSIHTDSRNLTPLFTPSFPLSDNLKPLYFIFCLLSQRSRTQRHLCSGESKVRMSCDSQLCWYTVGCFTWLHNKYVSYLFNVLTVCVWCMCTCVHMYKLHMHKEAYGRCWVFWSITLPLVSLRQSLPQELDRQVPVTASPLCLLPHPLQFWGYRSEHNWLLSGYWGLKCTPHVCSANTFNESSISSGIWIH